MTVNWNRVHLSQAAKGLLPDPYVQRHEGKLICLRNHARADENVCSLLYIGKAVHKKNNGLRRRLSQFYRSSAIYLQNPRAIPKKAPTGVNHAGGKSIWLLKHIFAHVQFACIEENDIVHTLKAALRCEVNPSVFWRIKPVERSLIIDSTCALTHCCSGLIYPFGNNAR
jgi:hypothetical protein